MELDLSDKVILITGATSGLGAALARRLVREGARVAICGRDTERVERTLETLTSAGGQALALSLDITESDAALCLVNAALQRWGRIDGVVNNAAQARAGAIDDVTDQDWHDDLELKVVAAARTVRQALPYLRAAPAPAGRAVLNVLNIGAKAPRAASLPSSASRAAGLALTKALSRELGPDGIRVNAILVGIVRTEQWDRRAAAAGVEIGDLYDRLVASNDIPLGRVGEPEEFAELASYLLSPRASYITGSAIHLDGGASPAY